MVGQHGLRESVIEEVQLALKAHELIKVRISAGDRDDRDQAIASMVELTSSELVQRIGNIAVLFRRNTKKPKIALPG